MTTITAEIGTSGTFETFELTGDAGHDIGRAVELEHPCDDDACDIATALAAGFPFVAAWLLVGATETPLLDEVLEHYDQDCRDTPQDWDQWVAHHKQYARHCEACNGYTYGDDYYTPETCGNCLAALPAIPDDDD